MYNNVKGARDKRKKRAKGEKNGDFGSYSNAFDMSFDGWSFERAGG